MILNNLGLEHPDITRARGLGASWWDEMEDLAERFEKTHDRQKAERND